MRDTNYDVAEAGVGARGGAAQGAGPRQDDGGHRHARSQLNNILHLATVYFGFFPMILTMLGVRRGVDHRRPEVQQHAPAAQHLRQEGGDSQH